MGVDAAVGDRLQQDRAAGEDDVAREQRALAAVVEQQRDVPIRVAGRVDHAQPDLPDDDRVALAQLDVDRARPQRASGG